MSGSGEPRWRRYLRFHGPDMEADIDDELTFHLEERVAMYEREGMSPDAARRAARQKLGDLDAVRRDCAREDRTARDRRRRRERTSGVLQDLRYGWRALRKRPGFTTVGVLTLGLGVGVTAGIFRIVDTVLLRPLPFPTADRIAVLWEVDLESGAETTAAPGKIGDWRELAESFEALAVFQFRSITVTGDGDPEQIPVADASGGVATVFGTPPALGRWFTGDEASVGAAVVVLGHDLWVRRFGGETDVVGRGISLDGDRYEIVGVMPPGFAPLRETDLWLALSPLPDAREAHYLRVAGLLREGVTQSDAQAEMDVVAGRLAAAHPETDAGFGVRLVSLREEEVGDVRTLLLVWLGAVGLVLLIGTANLANLFLARVTTRAPEIALRRSLGASRGRIVRQLLTENLLLAGLAGAVGLVVAVVLQSAIVRTQPGTLPRVPDGALDARLVLVALTLAVLGALAAGWIPAARLSKRSGRALIRGTGGARSIAKDRLMTGIIVGEIGLAVMLTVGAALLIQTLRELGSVEPGFATDGRVVFGLSLPSRRYESDEDARLFYARLRAELRSLPGVDEVGGANGIPLEGVPWFGISSSSVGPDGEPISTSGPFRVVTPGYFAAAGIPLRAGRTFSPADRPGPVTSVVLERRLAEILFPDGDPIGRRLSIAYAGISEAEVIGVVGDVRQYGLGAAETPGLYVSVDQIRWSSQTFVLRTGAPLEALAGPIRETVRALDPELPIYGLATVSERLSDSLGAYRFRMMLLTVFATLALLLGTIGVYGVLSYAVGQREREIGIRIAIGAAPGRVVRSFLLWGGRLGALGIAVGLAGAVGLTRLIESQLFGVRARDPGTFVLVAGLTVAAVLAAAWGPALRAAHRDPLRALRQE